MQGKWLHHRCRLGGPQRSTRGQQSQMAMWSTCGKSGCITPAVVAFPTLSAWTTMRNGYVVHTWAKWLHHRCHLEGTQRSTRGQQSQMAMWSTCGKSGNITPAVLGVPNAQRVDKYWKWLCGPHVGKVATSPLRSWGSTTLNVDNNHKWLSGPHAGKVATSPLPSWGSPTVSAWTTITNGYLVHMQEKWIHHPCPLGGPQRSTWTTITNGL